MKRWMLLLTLIALAGLPGSGVSVQSGVHDQWTAVDSQLVEAEYSEVEEGIASDQQGDSPDTICHATGSHTALQVAAIIDESNPQHTGQIKTGYAIRAPPVIS